MELPVEVAIHNELLGVKGGKGLLLAIHPGFFEVNCTFGGRIHRTYLPIAGTVLITAQPEPAPEGMDEIER